MLAACLAMAAIAFLSGLAVVGEGRAWQFNPSDIVKGRLDAILYVWITLSTIFSLWHLKMLGEWIFLYKGQSVDGGPLEWATLHCAMSFLFSSMHLLIHVLPRLPGDILKKTFIWGRVAA